MRRTLPPALVLAMVMSSCESGAPLVEPATDVTRSALAWGSEGTVVAVPGLPYDRFGEVLALSGDELLVGAPWHDNNAGQVSTFVRHGATWSFEQKISGARAGRSALFGAQLAFDQNTLVVGQPGTVIGQPEEALLYTFARAKAGAPWQETAHFEAPDATSSVGFAQSVALRGNTLVVGAIFDSEHDGLCGSSSAMVFARNGSTWKITQKIRGSDATCIDLFGMSVALSGDTLLVASPKQSSDAGAVFVFVLNGSQWVQQAKLVASDAASGAAFGASIALSGDTALIGAPGRVILGAQGNAIPTTTGAAYVFVRSGVTWSQRERLLSSDAVVADEIGSSVALQGPFAIVGAPGKAARAGAAYVFDTATWKEKQKLVGGGNLGAGSAVAVSGNTFAVGAPIDKTKPVPGAVTMHRFAGANGDVCKMDGECLSAHCADGVCCDQACGGGRADDCQACSVAAGAAKDGACLVLAPSRTCRAARSECDIADTCDGVSPTCPADAVKANGEVCGDGSGATCVGGSCVPPSAGGDTPTSAAPGAATDGGGCTQAPPPRRHSWASIITMLGVLAVAHRRRALRRAV